MRALSSVCLASVLFVGSTVASAAEWPELAAPAAVQGGGENDAALVMGVEDYAYVADVPGASANAQDWYLHLTKTRKVPAARVKLLRDEEVTRDSMLEAAAEVATLARPGGTLWVVFIGHGAPAADGQDGVLVGADAQQTPKSLYARSVAQKELLGLLGRGAQGRTVAIVDACFSGRTGSGALVAGLQPLLPVAAGKLDGKAIVLSAGAGNQFAGPLPGAARPAFSYLVLGALRGWGDGDADGKVTAAEAVTYARETIGMVVKGRAQTPELAFGDGAAVLAGGAKEQGPDLVAFVLERRPMEAATVRTVERGTPGTCPAGMAHVAGGSYVLGDRKDAATVAAFCMDLSEVTVAAYSKHARAPTTVDWKGLSEADRTKWSAFCNGDRGDRQDHPVNCVDWSQADGFCKGAGKRLPTEEEWEWAARGGEEGRVYPWGDSPPTNQACWDGEGNDLGKGSRRGTCRVGMYPSGDGRGGIHDLAGNVWEWTSTPSGSGRADRGGGWSYNDPSRLRAADRYAREVGYRGFGLGFRCARTP